jgi:peptidoglycan/LPS O-acetylase OafA/YrhL
MNVVSIDRLYYGFDTRVGALMIGSTLGIVLSSWLLTENTKIICQKFLTVIALLSAACLLSFFPFGDLTDPWMYYFGFFVVEVLTEALVLDILTNTRSITRKLLAMRWLVWIGSISYGLYIWHHIIYATIGGLGFYDLTSVAVGTPLSVLVAALSYYVMERPILKLKKRFTHPAPINSPRQRGAIPYKML